MFDATVRLGKKIDADEASKLDRTQMAVLIARQPQSDVEGQGSYESLLQCAWCGSVGWAWIDSNNYTWVTCGTCGLACQA
jgi:transcription elongation factor Elf1